MTDYLRGAKFPLPDDWMPEGYICVKVVIPDDPQYMATLTGLLDELRQSKNFARDSTGTGAAIVSRTWDRALNQAPVISEDCEMVAFRINPDNCTLEVNCSDDPEAPEWKQIITQATDPREVEYPPPYPDAPPEGQTNECLAAANITEWVWITGYNWAQQLDDSGVFAEFIVLVMGVIGGFFTLLTDTIIDNTVTFFTEIEPSTILADWTALDKPDFQNLIVCYLNEDGSFPASEWGNFLTELHGLGASNQAWYLIHYIMTLMGWGGVNLLGRIGGITEADCDTCVECDWIQTFDFTTGAHGWVVRDVVAGNAGILGGSGWTQDDFQQPAGNYYRGVGIVRVFDPTEIRRVKFTYDYTYGSTPYESAGAAGVSSEFGSLAGIPFSDVVNGTDLVIEWEGAETISELLVEVFGSYWLTPTFAGLATVKSVEVCGMGVNPFE